MSQSDLENEIHKVVSKEVQRNVSIEIKPEIIPFHALPIYKESTSFVLNEEEKEVIVDGEFRKALSEKGNAVSYSADVLEHLKLERVKTFILSRFDNYVTQHLQIKNHFYLTQSWAAINHKGDAHHLHTHPNTVFTVEFFFIYFCKTKIKIHAMKFR